MEGTEEREITHNRMRLAMEEMLPLLKGNSTAIQKGVVPWGRMSRKEGREQMGGMWQGSEGPSRQSGSLEGG